MKKTSFIVIIIFFAVISPRTAPAQFKALWQPITSTRQPPAQEAVEEEPVTVTETPLPPTQDDIENLLRQFDDRSATVREAAIRRLLPHPQETGAHVVAAFRGGNLNVRLTALELLKEWNAPIDNLDPWQSETLTPERLTALENWKAEKDSIPLHELTEEQRTEAAEEISRMLRISDEETEAVRERLARWKTALLPMVYERIKAATTDRERQRLLTLRYRLVAGESLRERLPDILLRLASTDTAVRRRSAEQLVESAVAEDQMLLRELFSDSDPLVWEISLRGIQKTGGQAKTMLLDLLDDPELNIRAAVLRQLEDDPGPGISMKIIEYVKTEKDADLVGHAVRVLRELRKKNDARATRSLIELLKHESWQVRADAAAALGGERNYYSSRNDGTLSEAEQLQVDVYVALIETLEDGDGFVVSKAVEGLQRVDMVVAVEPLLKVIEHSPDLAGHVVPILNQGNMMQQTALPRLRKMISHENPQVRAAILSGIPNLGEKELTAGMSDTDERVRIAAAKAVLQQFDVQRETAKANTHRARNVSVFESPQPPSLISTISNFFGFSGTNTPRPVAVPLNPAPRVVLAHGEDEEGEVIAILPEPPPGVTVTVETAEIVTESSEIADEKPVDDDLLQNYFASRSETVTSASYDQWLLGYYEGKGRLPWADALIEPLEKMLASDSLDERVAAAAVFVPFGRADEMVPLLLEASREKTEFFNTLVAVVPWLVREKRLALFQQWRESYEIDPHQFYMFLERIFEIGDIRNAMILWDMLAEPETSEDLAGMIYHLLQQLHMFDEPLPLKIRNALAAKLEDRSDSENENQRLIAMALLVSIAPDKAREVAERLDADTTLSDELRRDAFQIRLLTAENEKLRTEIAMDALKQKDPMRSKLAIRALVSDGNTIQVLRKYIYLSYNSISMRHDNKMRLPPGLELDAVKPLLTDSNEEIAGYAGYVAALLGEPSGIDPLLKYWRRNKNDSDDDDEGMTAVLVYRAVAALDDPQYVPVLREIYGKIREHEIRDFYWTIRSMTGPEILKLRKEIRDKYGMDKLQ